MTLWGLKEWDVCVHLDIEYPHHFSSLSLNVHYFFCSLQIIVGCIKWPCKINGWDCYVVIVSPNTELERYVVPSRETQVMVYVLMIFPKALVEAKNTKHLKKLFGFNKLLKFGWIEDISSLIILVGRVAKPIIILLNIQSGASLTVWGLHIWVPITNIVTKKLSTQIAKKKQQES